MTFEEFKVIASIYAPNVARLLNDEKFMDAPLTTEEEGEAYESVK